MANSLLDGNAATRNPTGYNSVVEINMVINYYANDSFDDVIYFFKNKLSFDVTPLKYLGQGWIKSWNFFICFLFMLFVVFFLVTNWLQFDWVFGNFFEFVLLVKGELKCTLCIF